MPGYNHYPWCTCGWCYKTRSGAYARPALPSYSAKLEGAALLAAYRVSEKRSVACFVNPNATCPVCGEHVYYYQNTHGSRVYFDDLGWPWPKHGCRDNRARSENAPVREGKVSTSIFPNDLRDKETSVRLQQAAHERGIIFKRTLESDGWLLAVLVTVGVFDNNTDATVSFLEEERPTGRFRYLGTSPFLKQRSIIAYKGDLVSLPDENLDPIVIEVKWLA